MKSIRQDTILELISSQDIGTQNELLDALLKAGINSTQATVSRDIKELNLIKELTSSGTYRYAPAKKKDSLDRAMRLQSIFRESITSFDCAQNIIVIKTLPGLASAACSAIDAMNIKNLVGTLAGDDTAFIAMADCESAKIFCSEIESML